MAAKEEFSRNVMLIGQDAQDKIADSRVAIFGIGGVGGYVLEALARAGVGTFALIDNDRISASNINRQIIALHSSIGKFKTEAAKDRVLDINPQADVRCFNEFFLPGNADFIDFSEYDYIVDAIDCVSAKIEIICRAKGLGVPVISSMGTGNKLDPSRFKIADIYSTSVCPLSRVMRRELKKRNIDSCKVLYSDEEPVRSETNSDGKTVPASISFVPSSAGLLIAGEVIKDIIKKER